MLWRIVVPCLIGIVWMVLRAGTFGTPTALLAIGQDNVSYPFVHHELPDAYVFDGNGFDGMVYYVIARQPLDVRASSRSLDVPTYRLRRILFPLAAKAMVPGGGVGLVYAFGFLSLAGIAIGGWWLGRFPGAPPWLPIAMVFNPGTICALYTSISDVLAAGLTVACFGLAFRRRFGLAILVLALAGLTRETSLVAVIALALWPGIEWPQRLRNLILPGLPVVAWSLYVSLTLDQSMFGQPLGGTFTAPFAGWVRARTPLSELPLAAFLLLVMVAAVGLAWRKSVPVAAYLVVTIAMFVCSTPIIANQWLGYSRVTTAALPLALWALVAPASAVARRSGPRRPRAAPT